MCGHPYFTLNMPTPRIISSKENMDNSYDFGGVEGIYSHPEPGMEKLNIYGPLKRSLVLYVSTLVYLWMSKLLIVSIVR